MRVFFKGTDVSGSAYKLLLTKSPDIPVPQRKIDSITIPKRDGKLLIDRGTYDDIQIVCEFEFVMNRDSSLLRFAELKKFFTVNKADAWNTLRFSDDNDHFYNVKQIKIGNLTRQTRMHNVFKVTFICEPYRYLSTGSSEQTSLTFNNPGIVSHPKLIVSGSGLMSLKLDGTTVFTGNITNNVEIDTDKQLAVNGNNFVKLEGDFENLYFPPGEHSLSVNSGFTIRYYPRWRDL